MSGSITRRHGVSQRIKNILDLVNHANINGQSRAPKTCLKSIVNCPPSEDILSHQNKIPTEQKNCNEHAFVDSLYSCTREYSMTSEVFQNFCETQVTGTSHLLNNISNIIDTLKCSYSYQPECVTSQNNENLFCDELMPTSPAQSCKVFSPPKSNDGDYDSDDSVKDKDYIPTVDDTSSDDTDDDFVKTQNPQILRKPSVNTNLASKLSSFKTVKPLRRHSIEATSRPCVDIVPIKKRRMTIDLSVSNESENTSQKSTKGQTKRRKYSTTLKERKLEKKKETLNQHKVKIGCDDKCRKKCSSIFTTDERVEINRKFWQMTRAETKIFVRSNYTVAVPKRKYTSEPKRNPRRSFTLPKHDGTLASVCKIFFLTTLGFEKYNDYILSSSLDTNKDIDRRGKHTKTPKFDRQIITEHIETFNPSAPHYRREHAPNRRYLTNEVNVNYMYKDFCLKHPDIKIGYELYRTHLKSMNISFTKLGNEECELCETYKLHTGDTRHDARIEIITDCKKCVEWDTHHKRYNDARKLYDSHRSLNQVTDEIYFSSDLEKVIMLPRLDSFKSVIFCPRLTAFNQTFAPIGKITKESKPFAAIWHDAIAGRKQEDIMSAYYHFFLRFRDVKKINIWMDNCTSQNKNWLFFSMLADLVNGDVIATEQITLYYFEPGHTYMSCDQFHHQVELSMKKKGKIYDFTDFEEAVGSANNGKVILKSLQPQDFINFMNNISERRIQNANPRVYLKNISQIRFVRSSFDLHYKNDFAENYKTLKFLNDKFLKNPQLGISFRLLPKGIEQDRKQNIIDKLSPIIPKHKICFWKSLPTCSENESLEAQKKKTRVTQ